MALRIDYYLRETLQGLRRNGLVAFAAVSTSFIALFLVGMALLVRQQVNLIIQATEADVEVQVYLLDSISPSQQQHLEDLVAAMPQVAHFDYESKEDAYRRAREITFRDQQEIIQSVSPDAFPASFRIKLKDPTQFNVVSAQLTGQPGIEKITDHRQLLTRLLAVTAVFRVGVLAVAIVMLISAAALIGNTVRMTVFARRKEIGIMRLVGATNWHIRLPFLIEGMIEGLIGAGAAIGGLFIMQNLFFDPLRTKIQFWPWIATHEVIGTIWWLLGAGVIVSVVASVFAMRRFLEV
jgi:cell division transport system permease protein